MIVQNQLLLWFIYTSLFHLIVAVGGVHVDETEVREFLRSLNEKSAEIASKLVKAQWEFETNNNENTKQELITFEAIENAKLRFQNVVKDYPWRSFSSPDVRQQLKLYSEIGMLALSVREYREFQKLITDIEVVQMNATICDFYNKTKCDMHLNPDIREKLKRSQNPAELFYLWREWRRITEPAFKELLNNFVKLCNEAAKLNNYTDYAEYSLRNIEEKDIKGRMLELWEDVKPLYNQIYAYVRRKLRGIYGEKFVPLKGLIPAHLLGNIWMEDWSGIADKTVPFPEKDKINFTSIMITKGYTSDVIHHQAEEFLTSINFSVPAHLWFNKSTETQGSIAGNCHSKIFNFYNNNVRIKDCGKVSLEAYLEAISLVTKAEYMLQYSHQPFVYQSPADPGLEEAVSDTVMMSTSTFEYLKKQGLYMDEITEEVRLNRLFKLALKKVMALPFLLVQEFSRWAIYSGKEDSTLDNLRENIQGVSTFKKELSYDPGGVGSVFSKLSLAHNFMGQFVEFQLYESLCHSSGIIPQEGGIFDECDLSHNPKTGMALRNMMNKGSSKPLTETLSPILGENKINSKSLINYFKPLMDWLTEENKKTGEFIGWEESSQHENAHQKRTRRKRSLEDYELEDKDDDSDNTPSREPDRFQRLIHKRSKVNGEDTEMSEREQKSTRDIQESKDKNLKNSLANDRKQRSADDKMRRMMYSKKRRSLTKKNTDEESKESVEGNEKSNDNQQMSNNFAPKNLKRHSDSSDNTKDDLRPSNNKAESSYQMSSKDSDSSAVGSERKTKKLQRRSDMESSDAQSHQVWGRKEKVLNQRDRTSRDAQWHTDSKKDISRLLHSFGFAVENEEKDKLKELKKKLKGDSNSDLKSNIASKGSSYGSLMDYNRVKPVDGRSASIEDKATDKLWSMKTYLADTGKVMQANPGLDKKETSYLTSSMIAHATEEKAIGKKETSQSKEPSLVPMKERIESVEKSSDSALRHLSIDMPSLQALLQKGDFNSFGQKPVYTVLSDGTENRARVEMMNSAKPSMNKFGAGPMYKYSPTDGFQYKGSKEYKDDADTGGKSPYIIILGQLSSDMKDRLMQEKGVTFLEMGKQPQLHSGTNVDDKKLSEKRSRASDQIYIVPIDLKTSSHNLLKSTHYSEHGLDTAHDSDTARDQESKVQLDLGNGPKVEDQNSFFKTGKENPSQYIISWNGEKNRKIVKRSKREHKKEVGEDKLKLMRVAPLKGSILEDLLGKSFDRGNLDDKNVKILIQDGLVNEGGDLSSALNSQAMTGSSYSMNSPLVEHSLTSIQQPSASLAGLPSNVLSALSPKSYTQAKANQHQESELEDENLKENGQAATKDQKEQDGVFLNNPGLRCNPLVGKKKGARLYTDDDTKKLVEPDSAARGEGDPCCKKIILTPCPPKCPATSQGPSTTPCPTPCPMPCPCPQPQQPCPGQGQDECCKCPCPTCPPCPDPCAKKNCECSLVNCQFKITKAKKPNERLTIMIYDRINPPAELPEPYDALAVISEILQRIQCCSSKPSCQLTEEDPDYPANDNTDQLKGNPNQGQDSKSKLQELSGEIPILGNDNPEEDETDDNTQNVQNSQNSVEEDKYQPKEKATPALDQLTVFNRDKLKPVFIDLRKISDLINKRSQQE